MKIDEILQKELRGSFDFFVNFTNLDKNSAGFGLTVDNTKNKARASIASVGFALTTWVIGCERGYLSRQKALEITRQTLRTLCFHVSHMHGFFAHFLHTKDGSRYSYCEYSTIDTSICVNGIITAQAYFQDDEVKQLAQQILERIDWDFIIFEHTGITLFRMAYNTRKYCPDPADYSGLFAQWDMAAEQKMIYLQAAASIDPVLACKLYHGFSRDTGEYKGQKIIINPGGNLFAYQFSEAWLDTASYVDPDEIDWFNNTRLAALANREFCLENSSRFRTYCANSWGISCGDSPWGYDVVGAPPWLKETKPNGTVSIYSALSCLPFIPELTIEMILYLYHCVPLTWGKYGFYDAYNLDIIPPWYSRSIYGIDKGCSMIMIENYLTGLIWDIYTTSPMIQKALSVLGFQKRCGG